MACNEVAANKIGVAAWWDESPKAYLKNFEKKGVCILNENTGILLTCSCVSRRRRSNSLAKINIASLD